MVLHPLYLLYYVLIFLDIYKGKEFNVVKKLCTSVKAIRNTGTKPVYKLGGNVLNHLADIPFTKFNIPYSGSLLLDRIEISDKLDRAVEKKLTIVNAPAGYGKSTAVSSWIRKKNENINFTWINLDKEDREEGSLWQNIMFSINQKEVILPYDRISFLSVEQCINLIINYFAGISSDCFIVFDDFHNMDHDTLHKCFEYFLSYIPPNLHCIIISRTLPSISISKLILDENVLIMDMEDLRFTREDINIYFNEIVDLKLTNEEVWRLADKTEGWIAALKAAALSLKSCADKSSYICNFDSSDEKIFHYIMEEVVNLQEAEIKKFLLKTSILKILNKTICNELTGSEHSQDILKFLEKNNLFIIRLDDRQENYRYHPLLSEVLVKMLKSEYPKEVNELYLSASSWYEKRGELKEAIEYSIMASKADHTIMLLEKYYHSKSHCEVIGPKSICSYFEALPCEMYNANPNMSIGYALALANTGQISADERELIELGINLDSDMFQGFEGLVNKLRAIISLKYENLSEIVKYAKEALRLLPNSDSSGITLCLILGFIYRSLGKLKEAEAYFSKALSISDKVNAINPNEASEAGLLSRFYMTSIWYLKGETEDFITPLKQLLNENITHKNCMYFCLAATHYDYGEFTQAYLYVMKGLELCNTYNDIFYEKIKGYVLLAKILYYTGKKTEAIKVMRELDSLVKPEGGNLFILLELPAIINLLVLIGMTDRADEYLNLFKMQKDKDAELKIADAQAELFLGRKDYGQVISRLEYINANMDLSLYPRKKIEWLLLKSIVLMAENKADEALIYLKNALETKGSEKVIRTFLDRGKPIQDLLIRFSKQVKFDNEYLPVYVEQLLLGFDNKRKYKLKPMIESEPLSDRELEVINLLSQGLSYGDIGKTLYISLSTVKKHTGNIYKKLKVINRMQAVNVAKEFGLIN